MGGWMWGEYAASPASYRTCVGGLEVWAWVGECRQPCFVQMGGWVGAGGQGGEGLEGGWVLEGGAGGQHDGCCAGTWLWHHVGCGRRAAGLPAMPGVPILSTTCVQTHAHTTASRHHKRSSHGAARPASCRSLQAPWGGVKDSGFGRELGPFGMEGFMSVKQVTTYVSDAKWDWFPERAPSPRL